MGSLFQLSSARTTLLALGLTAATVSPLAIAGLASAQTPVPTETPATTPSPAAAPNFYDVSADYWAYPFIQALAQRNIIAGFPDNSFKPNQSVSRAEFAAMIQKAFNQPAVRQLSSGGFRDVPSNYWAMSAIQKAYETGFMAGYPGNVFLPNQQIPKVQAIVALRSGLNLTSSGTPVDVNTYYTDASAIPNYAVNDVATATQSNIVVNYPDVKQLNPVTPLTRAEAAAILYQALVKQGQAQPIASNFAAANYIVAGGSTQSTNDIVSLAASSSSFTTLTSLLKTAGLTDILQQPGPYTVFAPTDEAFAALPPSTLQQLQQPENRELLIKILRYHVIPGELTASQLSGGEVKTFEDSSVNIKVDSATNQLSVNDARVLQPGVSAANGVIYPINQVLVPPNLNAGQSQDGTTQGKNPNDVTPGRSTRGGSSYIGVAGNIGLSGDSALGDTNIAVISKVGLTRTISVRPSAVFGDQTIVLVPVTFDFASRSVDALGEQTFSISPYVGAGVAIDTSDDVDFGFLLTGGVDFPLSSRFTINGAVNAAFMNDTDVGLSLGIGYNF